MTNIIAIFTVWSMMSSDSLIGLGVAINNSYMRVCEVDTLAVDRADLEVPIGHVVGYGTKRGIGGIARRVLCLFASLAGPAV